MSAEISTPEHEIAAPVSPRRLWYPIVAPPTAWALHEWVAAVLAVKVCESWHVALARWLVFALTIAVMAACVAGAVVAVASWRRFCSARDLGAAEATDRPEIMALAGIMISLVFTVGIAWQGLSSLLVSDLCGLER